jgi:hypothetical protein
MREKRNAYRILVGKPEKKRLLERPNAGERLVVSWVLERYNSVIFTGSMWLRTGIDGGLL